MPGYNIEKLERAKKAKDAFAKLFGNEVWFNGCGVSCFGEDAKIELRINLENYDKFIQLYEFDGFPINVTVVG